MKIYEAKNHILIHTEDISPSQHSHMAAHIIVSLGGRIEIQSAGQKQFCYGGLVPAGQIHKVNTNNNGVLVFLYDCSTSIAKQIKNFQVIPDEICKTISNLYNTVKDSVNSDNYYSFEKECLKLMGINCRENCETDERIHSAITYIQQNLCEKISCGEVANKVFLSQSRFSHLFKEKMGMTFSAYLIYQRLMYVYAGVIGGKSITTAALAAGFASSAHFADVNRRVFGISASNITANISFEKIR